MSRPLPAVVPLTLSCCAGLLAGLRISGPGSALAAATAACAVLLLVHHRRSARLALLALAIAGLLAGAAARAGSTADCRARLADGSRVVVRGAFAARPLPDDAAPFLLEELRGGRSMRRCRGLVRARIAAGDVSAPAAGAELVARARWWSFPPESAWPRAPERSGMLRLESVRVVAPAGGSHHPLLAARGAAQDRLRALLGERSAVAEALLLARQEALAPELRERFVRSGLAHLLAISGQHVALIAGELLLLARALRVAPGLAAPLVGALTLGYVLFLGAPRPALRAAFMILLALAARMAQRPADPLGILASAGLALAAWQPLALLDAGFQLSFAGTAGILLARRPLIERLQPRLGRWLADGLGTSLAATLATAPIAVLHFGTFAPIGVLANLLAVPLTAAVVPALALALLASGVSQPLAAALASGGTLLLDALQAVATTAARVPGGHYFLPHHVALGWLLAALAAGLCYARLRGAGRSARALRLAVAGVALAVLVAWPTLRQWHAPQTLEIHAIDVGQGDAIAIRSPAGRWLLVDAGPRSETFDAGRARVVPFLLRHGASRLEALILTHPDADHIGGAGAVLDALAVPLVIEPAVPVGKGMYLEVIGAGRNEAAHWIAARAGRELRFDDVVIEFLYPDEAALDGAAEANAFSVVFRLSYGRFAALFLGDAPAAVEERLVRRHGSTLRAHVLKVGHHGSATSTSADLLAAAAPGLALISVGRHNRYGHPAPLVLERLGRRGIPVLRTDRDGAIRVRVDAAGAVDFMTARCLARRLERCAPD